MPEMKHCTICNTDQLLASFKSGVVNGKFISERCANCFAPYSQPRAGRAAQYNLDREREDEARAVEQPYLPGGLPNPAFAHAYPKKAKLYYTKEQMEDL